MYLSILPKEVFPTLELFHDHLLRAATSLVEKGDATSQPMLFALTRKNELAIVGGLPNPSVVASMHKSLALQPNIRATATVFEAWVSNDPQVMPSDDPNRREAVFISILTAGRQGISTSFIERPSNRVHKAPLRWLDENPGEFSGGIIR